MKVSKVAAVTSIRIFLALTMLLFVGCATKGNSGTNGQSREEFTRYVESVFRLQNTMTSEIIALQGNDEGNNDITLYQAEKVMQVTCAPLNEYVSRQTEGSDTGLFLSRQVEEAVVGCDQAAQKVNLEVMAIKKIDKPLNSKPKQAVIPQASNSADDNKEMPKKTTSVNLDEFKAQCKELGFKAGTQDFGNCVLELNEGK